MSTHEKILTILKQTERIQSDIWNNWSEGNAYGIVTEVGEFNSYLGEMLNLLNKKPEEEVRIISDFTRDMRMSQSLEISNELEIMDQCHAGMKSTWLLGDRVSFERMLNQSIMCMNRILGILNIERSVTA